MALRDEIQELIVASAAETRAGQLFLEKGTEGLEQGLSNGEIQLADVLMGVAAIFAGHRDALTRLADEIDSLRN